MVAEKSKTTAEYEELTIDQALSALQADRSKGFSAGEADRRLAQFGPNEIPEKEETLAHRIFRRFWGPIPWMIEVAALLSAMVRKWEDFIIISVLLVTNAIIDFWQESKALSALAALKEKLAKNAIVLRDGAFTTLDARNLVPGDIVKVRGGDLVPADLKLIEGEYLQVDQSALTGESLPVSKKAGDIAYSNSLVRQGEMVAVVTGTGTNTFFGKTVSLVARAEREKTSHFQKAVISIGNYLIAITVFLVVVILIAAMFRHENMMEILRFALVLTVAAIPVALPAILSVTMAIGAINLSKKQAIVTRLVAIEELAGVDILCSDKTGTLTKNVMTVEEPLPFGEHTVEELMLYAALSSKEENSDPIEIPIFDYLKKKGYFGKLEDFRQKRFTPFDPVSKRTEAVVEAKEGPFVVTKGASQVVVDLCGPETNRDMVLGKVEHLAGQGFRTLCVAVKRKPEEKHFTLVGLIPLFDPPREDSRETIAEAAKLGVMIKMVTGDNLAIARHIGSMLGIGEKISNVQALKGKSSNEFFVMGKVLARVLCKRMSPDMNEPAVNRFVNEVAAELDRELAKAPLPEGYVKQHESEVVGAIEAADGFAQVFPEDKYLIVDKLQKAGHIVGMTGDGVNDAPALKKADAGIAVSGATDAARAAADLVLTAPGLSVIVDAVKEARFTFERMKSYSIYRIAETIRVILFMTASIVIFNFYPVTAIMIIILAFLNDLPILAIAFDRTKANIAPVRWEMIEVLTMATVLGILGVIASFGIFYIAREYMHLPVAVIQSLIFLKLAVAGHLTIFVTRTEDHFWRQPYPAPILFWAALLTKVAATIFAVYGWFIAPIGWGYALLVWLYSLAWFILNDFVKITVYRHLGKRKAA